jgi:hypothetical protein
MQSVVVSHERLVLMSTMKQSANVTQNRTEMFEQAEFGVFSNFWVLN